MKKTIYILLAALMMLGSCSDYTNIEPKGMNLLDNTKDIDLLLNVEYSFYSSAFDLRDIGGDVLFIRTNVINDISQTNKSRYTYQFAFMDSDEDMQRYAELTEQDAMYTACYKYIGKVANPVLSQLKIVSGAEETKAALKAEALTLRAFAHYLLLVKFAKAYNPATASQDPGIIYFTEDCDLTEPQPKKPVEECYQLALKDVDEAIALDALPSDAQAKTRFNKAASYAVKAHICMAMQKYSEAEEAAKNALKEDSTLYDYYAHKVTKTSTRKQEYDVSTISAMENPEVYVAFCDYLNFQWVNPDMWDAIEDGYATRDLTPNFRMIYKGSPAMEDYGKNFGISGWNTAWDQSTYINDSGLDVSRMLLVCAETELRNGNIDKSMEYLDRLRKYRLPVNGFTPLKGKVTSKDDAIATLKNVAFAENLWTPWNFINRKRWNVEKEWETTLSHKFGDVTYTLKPTSNLWVFPFPTSARSENPNLTNNTNQ